MRFVPTISASHMEIFDQCGCSDTHSNIISVAGEKRFDRHRKEPPGSSRSRGLYRLLPQLVGSYDPGGVRVSGDGGCRPDLGV